MVTTLVALPCEFCRRPRELVGLTSCGPQGCELDSELWPCSCEGARRKLRAELLEGEGHSPRCAAATARAWMAGRVDVSCALACQAETRIGAPPAMTQTTFTPPASVTRMRCEVHIPPCYKARCPYCRQLVSTHDFSIGEAEASLEEHIRRCHERPLDRKEETP